MQKLNKFSKIFLFLFGVGGVIWLGSYITRLTLFYRLFQEEQLVLREYITEQNLFVILQILMSAISINMIFYPLMTIAFFLFVISSKLNLRQNGWLFISLVIIVITLPFEISLMIIDYRILILITNDVFNSNEATNLIVKRFTVFSSFSIIEILSFFSILYLFMFQPLTKNTNT